VRHTGLFRYTTMFCHKSLVRFAALQEYSALDQFCGRFPSKAVREMAGDATFMSGLLTSLSPSISPTTSCVAAVVLGLQVRA